MNNPTTRRPIIALLLANAVSQLGNTMSYLAIPWFVLETTGSPSLTGIAVAMRTLPVIVVGLAGGAVVDRLGFRKASIISDLASGITIVMIPLLYLTVGLQFWQLLALIFLGAVLDMPGITARRSLFPDLAHLAGIRLERANATYQLVNRMAQLVGPPLAGVLVAALGASNVLWFNGATFVLSVLAIAIGIPKAAEPETVDESEPPQRYIQDVKEGFRFIWTERTIFWMIVSMSIGSLIAEPLYAVILPVYGRDVLDSPVGLGIAFSGLALGSIAGNLLYAWRGFHLPRRGLIIGGFAGRAVIFWLLVTQPGTWTLAGLLFLSGIILEPANPIYNTILQERVPPRMRGRVFAAASAVGIGTMPLGIIAYGFIMELAGLQATLAILATVNLALPVLMWFSRPLRRMEPAPPRPAPARVPVD